MVKTASVMLPLGTMAPDFALPDVISGETVKLSSYSKDSQATLIFFICNHCPYVKHIMRELSDLMKVYENQPVSILAINSNDPDQYPEDAPDKMKVFAKEHRFSFPYLFDGTQEVARSYQAACTPDFYLFNHKMHLVYRGQFDDSRPGNAIKPTGADLQHAIECALHHQINENPQTPSLGCNIKWKKDTI